MARGAFRWAVVLIGLVLAGDASAQYFGQNKVQYRRYDWRSIGSDHFEVYFYGGLDSLAMRVLDLAEKTNTVLSKRMGHQLGKRVPIILYGSHNDFAQTNVTPELIDAGTGGFTELLRNRVVLPFTGSYEDLRHVVVHELTHAFMFDMVYNGSAASLLARQSFFQIPLWFAEGMAEYFSLGMEPNAEMFLRDGIIEGYLPPLTYSGGYLVYKQGQSALSFLVERYGEERLRDVLRRVRQMRNFDRAFQRSVGVPVAKFDEQWRTWLRREYWPTVASKANPEEFGRRLTDHRHDESNINNSPAVSPQGDRIAYFSDRRQYTDVYIMSALDGKVLRRVIRGERNVQFEAIPSFRSSITWSPDGRHIALTAKSGGRDMLYVIGAERGNIVRKFRLPCEALAYPSWSPVSDSIVVAGTSNGRSDLWLVNAATGEIHRLTDDTYDEKEPTWSPDGRRITFSSDRIAPVVLHPQPRLMTPTGYGIFTIDLLDGSVTRTLDTYGDDHAPAWSPDGRRLAFISDRGGAPNIFLYDPADSSFIQLTDVLGGVESLSWSRQGDRLVFSAFNHGGFDVFAVKEPLSLDGVVARLRRQSPHAVLNPSEALVAGIDSVRAHPRRGALASTWPDSLLGKRDSVGAPPAAAPVAATAPAPATAEATTEADTLRAENEPPAWIEGDRPFPAVRDSAPRPLATTVPLVESGGPFAMPDSVLGQRPSPYHVRLAPDYAGGGFYASAGFGFVGSTQFLFSDFLGDHSLYIATDVFSSSLNETNALAVYQYLPRRWDIGGGVFHFKNYYSSSITTLGQELGGPRMFSERNFGGLITTSYPFDRFRRVEFNYTQMFVERQFFDQDLTGAVVQNGSQFQSVTSPSVSMVTDNTLFGYYGPVNGQRYNFTYTPAFNWFPNGLAYQTVTFDGRHYWDLTHGYTFAGRLMAGRSWGPNSQTFRVGGYSTLRGFRDFDLYGSRVVMMNTEFRFPFIQQLGLVGPVPIGIFNLRGAVFMDVGAVWSEGDHLVFTQKTGGKRHLVLPTRIPETGITRPGVGVGFGAGIRTALYFMILRLDAAWNTDLAEVSRPRWHVSIGPEF